jgi:hypothetical protein
MGGPELPKTSVAIGKTSGFHKKTYIELITILLSLDNVFVD